MRSVERAIAYEIVRQAELIDGGGKVTMETRGWDDGSQSTYHMRPKEEENDYRYFPEPDLPPLLTTPEWWPMIKARLPELPAVRRTRYQTEFGLSEYDSSVLVMRPRPPRCSKARWRPGPGFRQSCSPTWVTGEYMRLAKGDGAAADRPSRPSWPPWSSSLPTAQISGTNAKKSSPSTSRPGRRWPQS